MFAFVGVGMDCCFLFLHLKVLSCIDIKHSEGFSFGEREFRRLFNFGYIYLLQYRQFLFTPRPAMS